MVDRENSHIQIDLDQFKLHLNLPGQQAMSLHSDTPSRRFYLTVMALVLDQMKKAGKISFVPLEKHVDVLALLNETIGEAVGSSYLIQGQYDKAVAEGQKSIQMGPNSALSYVLFAQTLFYAGNPERAIAMGEQALKLCPNHPAWYAAILGRSYITAGRYEDALRLYKQVLVRARRGEFPLFLPHSFLAITYSMMGQDEKARFHLAETIKLNPGFSLNLVRKINFYKDPNQLEVLLDALRKAGLPDKILPATAASPS